MEVYAVINQKGGVGKSTTAMAVGAGLSLKGYSVLYVDLDAQGNLSHTMRANTQGYNSMGVLERPLTAREEIQHTALGDIIASTPALTRAEKTLTDMGSEYRLKEALATISTEYDYCIIDTPPALGILLYNALTACNYAIIPTQADIYSLQGIVQLGNTLQTVKRYSNPQLTVMGIVLTRWSGRATIRNEVADLLDDTAKSLGTKLLKTKIRECTALVEAQATRRTIYSYAPRSNATADYKALVDEILEEERGNNG